MLVEAPTLYPNGRGRRATPRIPFDPKDPVLPLPPQGKTGETHINKHAVMRFSDPAFLDELAELFTDGGLREEWSRSHYRKEFARFLRMAAMRAQVRTGYVGQWSVNGMHFFTRAELAELLDSHTRRDGGGVMRASQVDRFIKDGRALGLFDRFDRHDLDEETGRYKGKSSVFKLTPLFWELAGVAEMLAEYLRKLSGDPTPPGMVRAKRTPAAPKPRQTKAERLRVWKLGDLAKELVSDLTSAAVPDYGPNGPPMRPHKPPGRT